MRFWQEIGEISKTNPCVSDAISKYFGSFYHYYYEFTLFKFSDVDIGNQDFQIGKSHGIPPKVKKKVGSAVGN
ncbi:MAG: hypothetical protein JAY74_29010 [Candidatus Thiodiazotropha taylori]|nr:hypothetical protein [Candidatus Thiodiazotropha taylori]